MYKEIRVFLIPVVVLAISGCATRTGPVTQERPPEPAIESEREAGEAEVIAYRPPATPEYTRPEPARAVKVLMERAEDQRRAGQLVEAAGTLERALRMEPKNPVLWNKLAHVRLDQKQYELAAGLAAKSNHFAAPGDAALKEDNQRIIRKGK